MREDSVAHLYGEEGRAEQGLGHIRLSLDMATVFLEITKIEADVPKGKGETSAEVAFYRRLGGE